MATAESQVGQRAIENYKRALTLTADSPIEKIKNLYSGWADTYDQDLEWTGELSAKTCPKYFDYEMAKVHLDRMNARVIDAGAGTGRAGVHLRQLGYKNIDALDACEEMLNVAKQKGIYNDLMCFPLGAGPTPIAAGTYDGLFCTAALGVGHIGPSAFEEFARIVKPGGIICWTLVSDEYENEELGYSAKVEEMIKDGKWELVKKELIQYHKVAREHMGEKCYLFAFKVLKN